MGEQVRNFDLLNLVDQRRSFSDRFVRLAGRENRRVAAELHRSVTSLKREVEHFRPDVLLVNACNRLDARDLRDLRSGGAAMLVAWTGDDPAKQYSYLSGASEYDMHIVARESWSSVLRRAGIPMRRVNTIPYGADVALFGSSGVQEARDVEIAVLTVGTRYRSREDILMRMSRDDVTIVGWKTRSVPRRIASARRKARGDDELATRYPRRLERYIYEEQVPLERMRQLLERSAIYLNLQHPQMHGGLNPQVFNVALTGTLQVVQAAGSPWGGMDRLTSMLPTFRTADEGNALLDHFLKAEGERLKLANEIRNEVLSHHTNEQRMRELIDVINA